MTPTALRTRRWTRREYERLFELGVFEPGERLELIDGVLLVKAPQGALHFSAIRLLQDTLTRVLGPSWEIRAQGPIALDPRSEPKPDVALVPGSFRDYRLEHPTRAPASRISGSSISSTAGWKPTDRPRLRPGRASGGGYADVHHLGRNELVTPLILATARIPVSDLVP